MNRPASIALLAGILATGPTIACGGCGSEPQPPLQTFRAGAVSTQFLQTLEPFGETSLVEQADATRILTNSAPAGIKATFKLSSGRRHRLVVQGSVLQGSPNLRTRLDSAPIRWFGAPSGEFRQTVTGSQQVEVLIYSESPFEYELRKLQIESCESCRVDADLREEVARTIPGIDRLAVSDPLQAAARLLEWAAPQITFSLGPGLELVAHIADVPDAPTAYLEYFAGNSAGVYCGGAADFLVHLYRLFGLDATTIDFGIPGTTLTHVTVLVARRSSEGVKFYLFDPTFNGRFIRSGDGVMADLESLLDTWRRTPLRNIRFEEGDLLKRRWLLLRPSRRNTNPEHVVSTSRCEVLVSSHDKIDVCSHPSFSLSRYSEIYSGELRRAGVKPDEALLMQLLTRQVFSIGSFQSESTRATLFELLADAGVPLPE